MNFEKVSAEEQKQLEAKYSGKNLFPSKPEEGEEYTDGRIEDGQGGFSYPPEYTDGRVQDGEGGFAYPPEEPQDEVEQVSLDDVLKDRKTFEFYYKNGYFDMKGDIMPLLKDTLWNLVADTGYGLSTIPEGTIASFSGDKKKSAQALATRYQMYGDLEADWKTIWHGIFRAGNIAKQKIFDGEDSEDDIDSSYEFWTNYNRLEKERLVAVADRAKNDFFTYGIDPEIKDLIQSGKVTPDFRASRGLTNVFDPTNVGLFGAGAKAGMRGATELFQGAQRGLVKDTQKLMLKQNSIKQAIRTGTSATGRGAFGKSSSKELLEESNVISTQIGENLGKIKEMNKYRQQEMLNFVQNLERSHPLRKLIESNLKGIPVKGQRSALGMGVGSLAYGGGKIIENLGNTIRFVQTLPEEIATNYLMRTFKMSEEKASAMSKSIGTFATPLAVGAGGYAIMDEFTDNELLAWAGASTSLLPFFRRFGRDVAIMGREAMQPTTELSILQRIGSLGDESLAEIAIDRTKVIPFKSTFGAVAGTSDDTLKGIGKRISSGAGQKLSSKPMQMGVEALNRSGLGRYVESAGRVADQGFKGALMGGAFGIAGNPESPEGFLSGAVGGSAFAVTGYAFGKGIQKGTQLMGFNNTNEVIRARHGSHQYYVKHLLPEGERNAFMALPKDIQIAYANASMSYPHTTFNYINGGKEGKGGRQYRVDDDYFIEVNVDSDWAIEPLMRHEISHYLEQVGGTRSFDDILIGNHITESVGIFTKRDEKGNPIKTFDKDGKVTGYEVTDDFKEYKYLYGRFNFPDALNAEAKWNDIQKKGMEDSDLGQEIKEKFERHKKQVIDAVHDHVISREIVAEHGADYFLSDPRRYKDLRAGTVGLLMRRLVETPVLNNQPFLRNFIAKLGGTFRGDGLLESPNALFAKTKRIPAITELLRKYNRQIEGVSKDKINKRFEIPDEAEGKVVLDVKGADFAKNPELVEVLRSGTLMRLDKDGNIVPSQAMAPKEIRDYNKRFTEALSQAINQTEMEEGLPQGHIKERTTETGEKVFEGRYIDDKVIDRIEKMGGWNKSQIETLRNISRALKNKKNDKGGNDWLISYFKATVKGGGKYVNARVQNGVHIPYGLYMSKKGNIIVRTISLEQYIKNFDKALRQRKKEVIGLFGADNTRNAFMEASHIYHSNHAEGIHGSVGLDSDPVRAKEKADFLNAMFGATSKEHRGKNPWLEDVEGTKQDPRATYRSLRLERIGRADQLSGKRHVDPRKIFDNFMPQKPKDSSNPYRRDRVPALQGLADGLQDGSVTPEEYAQGVDENLPVQPLTEKDIIPATPTELKKAISEQKASKVKLPKLNKRNALKTGDKSALRLDIPSYDEFGVYVPTIYDGNGKTVSHQSTAVITDATFGNKKSTALNVAKGGAKSPFATIKGKYKKVTEKEAVRLAQEALKNEDGTWTQVGLDPERHSYFYDRLNHRNALTSADEVVQVGRAVFAKNAKKDSPVDAFGEDAYYMPPVPESKRTSEEFINRAIKKSSALEQMIDSLAIDRGVDPKELPLDELLSEAQFVLDTFSEGDHVNKSKGEANKIRNLIKNFGGTSRDTFGLPPVPNFMPQKAEGVDGIRVKHEDVIQLDSTNLEYFMPAKGVNLEDYTDRKMFALAADRLGVGQMSTGPIGAKKVMDVDAQGGRGFMYIFNQGGWAFKEKGTANSFLKRVKEVAGEDESVLVGITVLADLNHLNSPFGQLAYANALQATIDSGAIPKKRVDQHIREIAERIHNAKRTKDDDAVWKEDDKKVLSGEHVAGEFKNRWKKGDFTFPDKIRNKLLNIKDVASYTAEVKKKKITFDVAGKLVAKAKNKQLPIPADEAQELGIDPFGVASDIVDKGLEGLPMGDVVALLEVPVKQDPQNTKFHYSYPWTIQGKAIGFLNRPKYLGDLTNSKKIYNKQGNLTAQPIQTVMPVFDKLNPDLYMPQHRDLAYTAEVDGFKDNIRSLVLPKLKNEKFSPQEFLSKVKEVKGAKEMMEDILLDEYLKGKKSVSKMDIYEYISENAPYLDVDVRSGDNTKYEGVTMEGGLYADYSEILLKLPKDSVFKGMERFGNSEAHWNDQRVISFMRVNDRYLEDGTKTVHMEEVQSDWHQGVEDGYIDEKSTREYVKLDDQLSKAYKQRESSKIQAGHELASNWVDLNFDKTIKPWIESANYIENVIGKERVDAINKQQGFKSFQDRIDSAKKNLIGNPEDLPNIGTAEDILNLSKFFYEGGKFTQEKKRYEKQARDVRFAMSKGVEKEMGRFREHYLYQKMQKKYDKIRQKLSDIEDEYETTGKQWMQSNAPFKKSWRHRTIAEGVKRALEKGYNYISWTTGKRSAEMNDRDISYDDVIVRLNPKPPPIGGTPPTPDSFQINNGGMLVENSVLTAGLPSLIGEKNAVKVIEEISKGNDEVRLGEVTVNHTGRRLNYDQITPKIAHRISKFIGGGKPHKAKMIKNLNGDTVEVWAMRLPDDVGAVENIPLYMPNIGKELPASTSAGSITNNLYFKSEILAPEGAGTRVGELNTEDQEDSFYFKN